MRYGIPAALLATVLTVSLAASATAAPPNKKVAAYTSHGEAAYRHEERSKSQKQAVQAFLAHGVAQALSSLSGSTRGSDSSRAVQERILRQPERYVESYRVNSEGPSKGVYRVSGLVTVNLDSLKKDVGALAQKPPPVTAATPKPPAESSKTGPSPSPAAKSSPQDQPTSGRGVVLSKPSLFWAVPERLEEQDWALPGKDSGARTPFSRFLLQETEDLDWTVVFPERAGLSPDSEGRLQLDRVAALAAHAGSTIAVLGKVDASSARSQAGDTAITADLKVVEVSSGKVLGDVHKETVADSGSLQEALMGLAGQAAAQLDRLLQQDQVVQSKVQKPPERSTPAKPPDGIWVLNIHGEGRFAAWESLLKALRNQFSDLHITSVNEDASTTKIVIEGIDGSFFTSPQDAATLRELKVSVDSHSTDSRQIDLSVHNREGTGGALPEPRP